MYGRILLTATAGIVIGFVVSATIDKETIASIKERERRLEIAEIYRDNYDKYVKLSEQTCIVPPPNNLEGFIKWFDGPQLAGEMEGDVMRRKLNGEPSCMEEYVRSRRSQ